MWSTNTTPLLKQSVLTAAGMLFLMIFLSSCSDDVRIKHSYTYFEPVFATTAEIRNSFDVIAPKPITSAGKIYYLNGYIFLNEPGKGIHVINNSDPSRPVNEAFINIPGNYDMAARGNILYADSYIDLLAIDISDLNDVKIVKRVESVFPVNYTIFYADSVPHDQVILTEYREVKQVDVFEDDLQASIYPNWFHYGHGYLVQTDMLALSSTSMSEGGATSGVGGSMARFTITDNYLYTVDLYNLTVFDITNIADPVAGNSTNIGWDIETIFPYGDKLFIGSQSGMYIFDASDPENPVQLSEFEHARSCDPVIADGQIAYVTLRSGTECDGFTNQLDVINVATLTKPVLMKTYPMQNPHGLGKDGDLLFIAEGDFGLKIFDAEDPMDIDSHLLVHYENIHAYDVIPLNGILLMTGEGGLYQYDYSDPENIEFLSVINVNATL